MGQRSPPNKPNSQSPEQPRSLEQILQAFQPPSSPYVSPYAEPASYPISQAISTPSSTYFTNYHSLPQARMSAKAMSSTDKQTLITSLRARKVNTLTELRRIEKISASVPELSGPLTEAWTHYVNSHNLLNELRGLTKSYPFSSECLDEAKHKAISDPASMRGRNYCWGVLNKIKKENLVPRHARLLATKPAMWGGRTPTAAGVDKLAAACHAEWTKAVDQMLRNWA